MLAIVVAVGSVGSSISAGPILKPRKYHGPIPQQSITLRAGFLGGANNSEMITYWESLTPPPFEGFYEDFGNGLSIDLAYTYKPHPQFGVRASGSAAFLSSTGTGLYVAYDPSVPDTLLQPQVKFDREFAVDIFLAELSALYYFADASVKEFQSYVGAGFTFGFPHGRFSETRVDPDTGERSEVESDEWSFSAGVHAILGAQYYVTNRWAVNAEGRLQLLQSKYPLPVFDDDAGEFVDVKFDVDYSGFFLAIGVVRGF